MLRGDLLTIATEMLREINERERMAAEMSARGQDSVTEHRIARILRKYLNEWVNAISPTTMIYAREISHVSWDGVSFVYTCYFIS